MRKAIWFIQFIGDLLHILRKFCIPKTDNFADLLIYNKSFYKARNKNIDYFDRIFWGGGSISQIKIKEKG